ncbi:hypothetical protein [Luteipulveratus mongoliensis]|uniref:Uncharacterized protein n=1 Tax=Luteipulveratus mongoliensis TaxID=571913 RepID=A0A0K1JGB4_9MICO|nr:hypothetical protein [Luteipulveratus mongoliensis]AKU15739.1 hypothetical protein VV02_07560 [Luteipulveratus mongoliensis]
MNRDPFSPTTARHPIAIAVYAGFFALSICYLIGRTEAHAMDEVTGGLELAWQIPLLVGSGAAFVGALLPRRLFGLFLEGVGVAILGAEVGAYVWSIYLDRGFGPLATLLVFGFIAAGCFGRSAQAIRERGRALQSVEQITRED